MAVTATMIPLTTLPWLAVATALHQHLLPLALFFAGLLLTPAEFTRIGRVMAILAGLSVAYGLIQMAGGPTILDRAWASETYSYSIHGSKVFAYLEGASTEFRVFSYYADPLTWGLFLLAGFVGGAAARDAGRLPRALWYVLVLLVLGGLFCAMTRTVWVGLLATMTVHSVLRYRIFRRAWLIFGLSLGSFAVAVSGGDYLYRELFLGRRLPAMGSVLAARYLNVGTIEARVSAWAALQQAVRAAPILGQGSGALVEALRNPESSRGKSSPVAHNFIVELVVQTGLPGALAFLLFYLQWLREGFAALRRTQDQRWRRTIRLIIAFSVGSILMGYLNGASFMTHECFLILGVLSGYRWRLAAAESGRAARSPSPAPVPLRVLAGLPVREGVAG